jgi:outer membrane protein OmpA-like peptidoglycan-associated protein
MSVVGSWREGETFILAGHTDASGSREYNQVLSERRALAVKNYLISRYGVPENQLAVIGYGPDKLKFPDKPYAGQNRRVEVVNMGQVALKPSEQ